MIIPHFQLDFKGLADRSNQLHNGGSKLGGITGENSGTITNSVNAGYVRSYHKRDNYYVHMTYIGFIDDELCSSSMWGSEEKAVESKQKVDTSNKVLKGSYLSLNYVTSNPFGISGGVFDPKDLGYETMTEEEITEWWCGIKGHNFLEQSRTPLSDGEQEEVVYVCDNCGKTKTVIENKPAVLYMSDINCVLGENAFLDGSYTAHEPENIDSELNSMTLTYDDEIVEIGNKSYIKSSDNKTATITADVTPKKYGATDLIVSVPNVGLEPKTVHVNVEPELVLPGATVGNMYNHYACKTIYSDYSLNLKTKDITTTKDVIFNVSIDESDAEYLESFLNSIVVSTLETSDLTDHVSYKTSYTIADDGKSAEFIVTINCGNFDATDYISVKTPAQEKVLQIVMNSNGGKSYEDYTYADFYIIGEVEKYCMDVDDDFTRRILDIYAEDTEWAIKQNELLKVFSTEGINDIREGMDYLRNYNMSKKEALPYRWNYKYLTSNEVFCASQFDHWIMSDDATAQRNLLYASGMIFNNELFDSLDSFVLSGGNDPVEYYPEAKKNREMLRSFIESTTKSDELLSNSEKTGKYINSVLKVFGTKEVQKANIDDLHTQMYNSTTDDEWNKLYKTYINTIYGETIDTDGKVHLNVKSISKALGYSTSILSFASSTTDDIIAIINLESEVEFYQQNIKFLENIIYSPKATFMMKIAAESLLEDINTQYKRLTDDILRNTFDFAKDTAELVFDFDFLESVMGKNIGGFIGEILGTYKLGVAISNMVINTGDFVKQTSYTQGYAQLGEIYTDILEDDKIKFNTNKTAENAWQFFEDYTILWQLRYSGEEQYEKAQHVKSFFGLMDGFGSIKGAVVYYVYNLPAIQYNLGRLDDAKFNVSKDIIIPDSVQYKKKAVIQCPVDILVYNNSGDLIATLKDGEESDVTNKYGRFAVVYNPFTDEYEKVICQLTDEEFTLKIVAVDDGIVDFKLAYMDSDDTIRIRTFEKEELYEGDIITISTSTFNDSYNVDANGDGTIDAVKQTSVTNGEYVKVGSIKVDKTNINLTVGDTDVIAVDITPNNATYTALNWASNDSSIVEISNGKITAKSAGQAEISVLSIDNPTVYSTIQVTVEEKQNDNTTDDSSDTDDSSKGDTPSDDSSSDSSSSNDSTNDDNSSTNDSSNEDASSNDSSPDSNSSNDNSSDSSTSSSDSSNNNSANNSSSSSSNTSSNSNGGSTASQSSTSTNNTTTNLDSTNNPKTGDAGTATKAFGLAALMLGVVTVLKKKKQ